MKATASKVRVLPDPDLPSRPSSDAWASYWQSFELELAGEKASPRTLAVYRESGSQFRKFLEDRGYSTDPLVVKRDQCREFIAALLEKGAKPATVRTRYSALRKYFNFLVSDDELDVSPMAGIKGPKVDEPAPTVLTVPQLQALLKACEGKDFYDYRDRAMILLMIDSGLRRAEVAGLTIADVDLANTTVWIVAKGRQNKEPRFYGVQTARALDKYLRVRGRHKLATLPNLYLAQKGPLSGDGVHHAVQRRGQLAGIGRPIWPHLLRHCFAAMFKAGGASDELTMTAGGWKDHKSMRRYGESARQERARDAYRTLAPSDRL